MYRFIGVTFLTLRRPAPVGWPCMSYTNQAGPDRHRPRSTAAQINTGPARGAVRNPFSAGHRLIWSRPTKPEPASWLCPGATSDSLGTAGDQGIDEEIQYCDYSRGNQWFRPYRP